MASTRCSEHRRFGSKPDERAKIDCTGIQVPRDYGHKPTRQFVLALARSVIGNTSDFESEESRFEPWRASKNLL